MTDVLTKAQRSFNMSRIRGKNTKPELLVRSILHSNGYRYRLHVKNLPGNPDIVLPRYMKIVDVRGCFWHKHNCKYGNVKPKTNNDFWEEKRRKTVERDTKNLRALKSLGWNILTVWECEIRNQDKLKSHLVDFMAP